MLPLIGLLSLSAHSSKIPTSWHHVVDTLPAHEPFVSSSAFWGTWANTAPETLYAPFSLYFFFSIYCDLICAVHLYLCGVGLLCWNVRPMISEIFAFLSHCD